MSLNYHHQFGVDDFADEAALPLKIECIGATLTVELFSKVPLEAHKRLHNLNSIRLQIIQQIRSLIRVIHQKFTSFH